MFRSFIYLDDEKMYSYLRLIDNDFANRPLEINKKRTKGGRLGLAKVNLEAGIETEEKYGVSNDLFNDYDRFEKDLESLDKEKYFDFVLNDENYDVKTVPGMSIIRINGRIEIPEEFDMYNLAQNFMPLITSQIETESDDEKELMDAFMGNASADVPVLLESGEVIISGKLNMDYLNESYAELEDYNEQEVYMLCKVIGVTNKNKVEIFNPYKDFVKLPRAIRRSIDTDSEDGLESIVVDGPVLKVEVISIYK